MGAFLAFDLGAESGRAVLGRLEADRLVLHELHRFANRPLHLPSGLHWNVFLLFEQLKCAMAAAKAEAPLSLGIDTWGVDFALLSRDGELLGLPHTYRDPRNEGAMESFLEYVPRRELYQRTGVQLLPFNSVFQLHALQRARSPLLEAASHLAFMPDLFNFLLTGRRLTELTCASTSGLLDPRRLDWDPFLLEALGLESSFMQPLVEPGTLIGPLLPEVREETGLEAPVVAVGSHDTASAVAAVPAESDDFAYISSGTWSLVGVELTAPLLTEAARRANLSNEGGVGGTIRLLKNVMGLWLVQRCRRDWALEGPEAYAELSARAEEATPFAALIDPDHPCFFDPEDMPEAIRRYCERTGQRAPEKRGAVVRCVLDSLALRYRQVLDEIRSVRGVDVRRLHVIGGGSRNRLLCRLTADATGLPVIPGPAEATAVGNILVQAVAMGALGSVAEGRALVAHSELTEHFEPRRDASWDGARDRFREICDRGRTP